MITVTLSSTHETLGSSACLSHRSYMILCSTYSYSDRATIVTTSVFHSTTLPLFNMWQPRGSLATFFYVNRLMNRPANSSHLLLSRDLFQQFRLTCKPRSWERLLFIRQNQRQLRAETYIHLRHAIRNDGDIHNVHQLVILLSLEVHATCTKERRMQWCISELMGSLISSWPSRVTHNGMRSRPNFSLVSDHTRHD